MLPILSSDRSRRAPRWLPAALTLAILIVASRAGAYPPRQPVPIPYFTFDAQSPSVIDGQPGTPRVNSDAVLAKGQPSDPVPATVLPGANLGLGMPGDELDGISFNRTIVLRQRQFVLLFSVSRGTTGEVPPNPALVASDAPFNVADQVMRGHAAGDGFMSLRAFDSNGPVGSTRGSTDGNGQPINNYDEGGQDYQALPTVGSKDHVPPGTFEDNVNGTSYPPTSPTARALARGVPGGGEDGFYFTVSAASPTLQSGGLPGDSGADIFFDPNPELPGLQAQQPYAYADQLGLTGLDDIDALIVDDSDTNGLFGGDDCVYISLTPESPTLAMLSFASSNGAADVYRICATPQGFAEITPFAAALQLGLAGDTDDIDALEIIPCDDATGACAPLSFAAASSIRFFPGDWNNDGAIGAADAKAVPFCLSGPYQGLGFVAPSPVCRDVFDFNNDTDVDLADFGFFQFVFGTTPGAD